LPRFDRPEDCRVPIGIIEGALITPPSLDTICTDSSILGELETEEDQDGTDGDARVESSGENIVVLAPPGEVPPTDVVLEDETDDTPRYVVDGSSGRDETGTGVDDGEIDVFDEGIWETASENVGDDGGEGSDEEEEEKRVVDLSLGELASGTDETPDDGGRSEDLSVGADEVICVVGVAYILDILSKDISLRKRRGITETLTVNIQACTPSCVVPAMTVATTWHQNIGL
jgi:hypothetical protein